MGTYSSSGFTITGTTPSEGVEYIRNLSETVLVGDLVTKDIQGGTAQSYTRNLSDIVRINDSSSKNITTIPGVDTTRNLSDTVEIAEVFAIDESALPGDATERNLSETILIDETFATSIDTSDVITRYLEETVLIGETFAEPTVGADPFRFSITDTVLIGETRTRSTKIIAFLIWGQSFVHNHNVSFGETKNVEFKRYENRFRWGEYRGLGIPGLNFKDLKEPLIALIPSPSFLEFEYGNSFIIWTRNTINRFVLIAGTDPGEWTARTDNLIEEYNTAGLMQAKTLVRAGQTMYWRSEDGVMMWNRKEFRNISKGKINIAEGDYEGFYLPVRRQYFLHRNAPDKFTYVYDEIGDKWTPFSNIDIVGKAVILSGGDQKDNVIIFHNSNNDFKKYPGDYYTTEDAHIETKEWNILKGVFQRWQIDFVGGSGVDITTKVRRVVNNVDTVVEDLKENVVANEMRQVALANSRGRTMSIKIANPNIIKSLLFDIKQWGEEQDGI